MRQQAVDVRGVVADLGVVPVVGVAGGAEHAGSERGGDLGLAGGDDERLRLAAGLDRIGGEQLHGRLEAAGEIEPQRVDHAAPADAQRLGGQVLVLHGLDEACARRR